jgi:hypothetical protein|nr:MAG TPA: hypothetical protein [Caudoviricetes sp.]
MTAVVLANAFCDFLKSEGVMDKFMFNIAPSVFNAPSNRDELCDLVVHLASHNYNMPFSIFAESLVSTAFTWRSTPEGHVFWKDVSACWVAYFRSLE